MKIWEVELATECGTLGEKLVKAEDYQDAVKLVTTATVKDEGLNEDEKAELHVIKVALYCETDVGE